MKATIFKTIYAKNEPHQLTITKALHRIRDGASRTTVESVRQGNKEDKLRLPAVLFSGEFSSRHDDDIHEHSGFIVLDFDHVEVDKTKSALATDDYIHSCWVSPSGTGVKALVKVANPERHRDHFRALVRYFDDRYGLDLDESGINESRACFESYDPDIVIKESSVLFSLLLSEEGANAEPDAPASLFTDYTKLNIAARMVRNAPDGQKHDILIKAATLCGGYVAAGRMEEEEVMRVLTREIQRKDIDSLDAAILDIRQGIQHGKTRPIKDTVQEEEEALRRMQIEDGDFSFLSEDDSDFEWIQAYSEGRIPHGLDTGSEELDKYFRYKKELVIFNGHSNVGKTTVALYLIANAAVRHDWKWLIYSAENKTSSVKMQLMQMYMDKRVGSMSYAERKLSFKWVQDHFHVVNNDKVYSYLDILLFMEKVNHHHKIDAVFVDPYNSLRLDLRSSEMKNPHDYHYEAATAFLTFSNNHDVAVWLNMHAMTEAQRRKGNDGLPVAPYAEDTEGGGKFVNRADCFVTIHRKVQAPDPHTRMMSEIHVRKVRETETGGKPTPLEEPFKLNMNSSHTGFVEWGNQKKMLTPYKQEGKQTTMPVDRLHFEIRPNEDFIRTFSADEEAQGGDTTQSKA